MYTGLSGYGGILSLYIRTYVQHGHTLETPDLPVNAGLKPPRKQVWNPDLNPHYSRRVNATTHINLGFNAD